LCASVGGERVLKHYSFNFKKINFKVATTAMYTWISGEWAKDPVGSMEQALKTNVLVYPVTQRRKQNQSLNTVV